MRNIDDAPTSVGRTDLAEARVEPRLRAIFAAVDADKPVPVTAGADGTLVGEMLLEGGAIYLPEQNSADIQTPPDRVGAALRAFAAAIIAVILLGLLFYNNYSDRTGSFNWLRFSVSAVVVFSGVFFGYREINVRLRIQPAPLRPGNPGVFLLPDVLVVRRDGICQVFPRTAITEIEEVTRTRPGELGAPAIAYPITQIQFQGPRGSSRYSLDVGPPAGLQPTPELAAAERVRGARLRRLQAWLRG